MRKLLLALTLTLIAGCAAQESAPDAILSTVGGNEIAVPSWEFCGPDNSGTPTCLDGLPSEDLPTLVLPGDGSWNIDRPDGYTWDITYSTGGPGASSPVLVLGDRDGDRITEIPQPGTYVVDMRGRTDETVGVWTFELVIQG